jgi:hypothetical protein
VEGSGGVGGYTGMEGYCTTDVVLYNRLNTLHEPIPRNLKVRAVLCRMRIHKDRSNETK